MTEDARANVERAVKDERKLAAQALQVATRAEVEVRKDFEVKSNAYWRLAKKTGFDDPPTAKEAIAAKEHEAAQRRYGVVSRSLDMAKEALKRLDDPDVFEARVIAEQDRLDTNARLAALPRSERKRHMATATRTRKGNSTPKAEVPQDLRKRIAKLVREGNGVSAVANMLNEEGVKRPSSGKADWYARAIYNIATKELGVDGLSSVRDKKPLKRSLKDRAPAKTQRSKPSNGNGNGKPAASKPAASKPANGKAAASKPAAKPASEKRTTKPDPKPRKATTRKSATARKSAPAKAQSRTSTPRKRSK